MRLWILGKFSGKGAPSQRAPIGCAAPLASLDVVERDGLVERSAKMGQVFAKRLEEMKDDRTIVGGVRGMGMTCGL